MEQEVKLTVNGQEVQQGDLNLIAEEAAHGSDWLLAELLRPSTPNGAVPAKYVIPAGSRREFLFNSGGGDVHRRPIIGVSGSADAKVRIAPFTAVIASNVPTATDVKKALRNIRTVGHYGDDAANTPYTDIQLPATTDRRWDALYAKVDIDLADSTVTRFVKSGAGAASSVNLSVTKQTRLTLGFVAGVEHVTDPVLPSLPADSSTTFYVLLGYVKRGGTETLTQLLSSNSIWETYSTIPISPALGGAAVRPADGVHSVDGYSHANELNDSSHPRPKTHMPPGMVGKEELFIPIHAKDTGSGNPSCPANTFVTLDASVDWRRRIFKTTAGISTSNDGFPWSSISPPAATFTVWDDFNDAPQQTMRRGQSFIADTQVPSGGALTGGCVVAWFSASTTPALAAGAMIIIYVDLSTGQLRCWRNNVNAARFLLVWLEASAPFLNTDIDGL